MNRIFLEKVFSIERMEKYFNVHLNDDVKAIKHYHANVALSEAFYPILSIFEVALRNSINRELIKLFNTQDWYLNIQTTPGLKDLNKSITIAKTQINKRGEIITGSKVVAELTLGFWVRLFNAEYELILWKDIRRAFPYMPKNERKRNNLSAPLNKIRNFRNRVYHNEPIAWNLNALESIHLEIITVLGWLNNELPNFANEISRFQEVLLRTKYGLE